MLLEFEQNCVKFVGFFLVLRLSPSAADITFIALI